MMLLDRLCLLLVLLAVPVQVVVGQYSLRAVVRDSVTSEPLAGVTVMLVGTSNGASSDKNGVVELTNIPSGARIVVLRYIGYKEESVRLFFPLQGPDPVVILLQPQETEVEGVEITSMRINSRIEDTPIKVEVLGTEDLTEENSIKPGNVASILGDISSIQIQQTSPVSGNSVIRMQGLDGKYTLLLRDGMPTFGGLSGGLNILQIPPLDLRQIEIIKGPASTLFGGGAIAGLINFVAKQPGESPEAVLTLNQSTLNETNFNGYLAGKKDEVGFTLFAGFTRQQPADVNGDDFSDVPQARTAQLHPKIFLTLSEKTKLRIGLSGVYEERTGGFMQGIEHKPDTTHQYFEDVTTTSGAADFLLTSTTDEQRVFSLKGSVSYFQRELQTNYFAQNGNQWNGYSEISYLIPDGAQNIVLGGNVLHDSFRNNSEFTNGLNDYVRNTLGVFAQYSLNVKDSYNIQVGLRGDWQNQYGWFVLPSAAVLFHLNHEFSLRLNGGSGYEIPNILDVAEVNGTSSAAVFSPTTLEPERSVGGTAEWNYEHVFSGGLSLFVNQTFFYTRIQHAVVTLTDFNGDVRFENAPGHMTSAGIDNYIRIVLPPYEVYLGYTYTVPKQDFDTRQPYLTYTPLHRAAATVVDEINEHWRLGLEASYTGYQYRGDGSTTTPYLFLAGMIQYKSDPYTIVLNGENLLDFLQTKYERVVFPPLNRPSFAPLWAPVDGRVLNLSLLVKLS